MTRLRGTRAGALSASAAADKPAVTVVPRVPLLDVGMGWHTSTGDFTFTAEDIASAVAAQRDHALPDPVLKLGHIDPRFDGQPSIGRVVNLAASDNGMTLFGDFAGVPTWLADNMATLYPRRSVEGQWDHRTAAGVIHRFALTAVALLGAAYPAIGTLADIPLIIGDTVPNLVPAAEAGLLDDEPTVTAASGVTVRLCRFGHATQP